MAPERRRARLAFLALLAGGCAFAEADPAAPFAVVEGALAPAPPGAPVRRVLLLPLAAGDAPAAHPSLMQEALAQALRAACGFEVVAPHVGELPRTTRDDLAAWGVRRSESLIRLHREWGCDAVVSGRLAFSRPHGEPAAGLELALVDARDGRLLWTARGVVDARVPATRASLQRFRELEAAAGDDLSLVPAESFARFVAASFVRTLYPDARSAFPERASDPPASGG